MNTFSDDVYFIFLLLFEPGIFIVSAKRTAFGTYGGALKNTNALELQIAAAKAAIAASGLQPEQICTVNIGNVLPYTHAGAGFMPRHAALHCGIPIDRPALTINRLCGSGFQSVVNGAQVYLDFEANFNLATLLSEIRLANFFTLVSPLVFH